MPARRPCANGCSFWATSITAPTLTRTKRPTPPRWRREYGASRRATDWPGRRPGTAHPGGAGGPAAHRAAQLALTLERLRRLPPLPRGRTVVVNVPAYRLWAFDSSDAAAPARLEMRVIVGTAARTPTPSSNWRQRRCASRSITRRAPGIRYRWTSNGRATASTASSTWCRRVPKRWLRAARRRSSTSTASKARARRWRRDARSAARSPAARRASSCTPANWTGSSRTKSWSRPPPCRTGAPS